MLTGWDPSVRPITGDFTMAFFMKLGATPPSPFYIMGAPSGGVRLFTAGIAGRGLYQRQILASGGNGLNATIANDFYLPASVADIQTLAAAGWVHVAMVVDATAATATWYVNGLQVLQLTSVVGGANIFNVGNFQVGYYSSASAYDLDEFLISLRAYTAPEILAMSMAPRAGDGDYTMNAPTQCGTLGLGSAGGPPTIGNANYSLQVMTSANGLFSVLLGFDRCFLGGTVALPIDAGMLAPIAAGCQLLADPASTLGGVATGTNAFAPLPIPNIGAFAGVNVYSQAVLLDFLTTTLAASNGFAIGVGY